MPKGCSGSSHQILPISHVRANSVGEPISRKAAKVYDAMPVQAPSSTRPLICVDVRGSTVCVRGQYETFFLKLNKFLACFYCNVIEGFVNEFMLALAQPISYCRGLRALTRMFTNVERRSMAGVSFHRSK